MRRAVVVMMLVLHFSPAAAQQQPDAVATAPLKLGPFGLAPRMALTNVGIDNNVFNEVEDPKQDFTFTASPGVELWLRIVKGMLSVQGRLDYSRYAKYSNQGAVNSSASGQFSYPFNRVRPVVTFSSLNARERPGYEIDARVRRYEDRFMGGVDVRMASKSSIQFDYREQTTSYAEDAVYAGQELDQSLNRKVTAIEGVFRHNLTPLTTFVVQASSERERFGFATERNSNTERVSMGFELGRFALIRGRAHVGFRNMAAAEGGFLPPFRGLIANIDVSYTAPSQTRLTVRSARDVQHSYDPKNPYYVQTGLSLTLTQRIIDRWDFQATAGRDRLGYRTTGPSADGRNDYIDIVGGGIGYQATPGMRLSFDVSSRHRLSALPGNDYRTIQAGGSVTYGY